MKRYLLPILLILVYFGLEAQNIIIQQNNQQQQKETVIVKEKPVYIKENEQSEELTAPILIHGYLFVYPTDLGDFSIEDFPYDVIQNINKVKAFGRSTWRLPTESELELMIEYNGKNQKLHMDKTLYINAHVYRYMIQDSHGKPKGSTGVRMSHIIRLVSTD